MSGPKEKEESSSNATGAEKRPLRLEELRFPPPICISLCSFIFFLTIQRGVYQRMTHFSAEEGKKIAFQNAVTARIKSLHSQQSS